MLKKRNISKITFYAKTQLIFNKIILLTYLMILMCLDWVSAQNLVPNGSFEQYDSAPINDGDFDLKFWNNISSSAKKINLTEKIGTPDYLSTKGSGECKIPSTAKGWIQPRTGEATVGLVTYNESIVDFREYISVKLENPLNIGDKYIVSFFISVSQDENIDFVYSNYFSSGLGILFSSEAITQNSNERINRTPNEKISYPLGADMYGTWKELSFIIKAEEKFEYLTIGNFDSDANTIIKKKNKRLSSARMPVAYYFIDDVSIIPLNNLKANIDKSLIDAGENQIICEGELSNELQGTIVDGEGNNQIGTWKGGNGDFIKTNLGGIKYKPAKDEAGTNVTLIYSYQNDYSIIKDSITLKIMQEIKIDAGEDIATDYGTYIELNGSISSTPTGSSSFLWSGGEGFFSSDEKLITKYFPSFSEIGSSITLKLNHHDSSSECFSTYDNITIFINETNESIPEKDSSSVTIDEPKIDSKPDILNSDDRPEDDFYNSNPSLGRVLELKTLKFQADSFKIVEKHLPELKSIHEYLKKYQNIEVEIGGHTNTIPGHVYCDKLSFLRAESIYKHLVALGIPEERIKYKGYGKRKPKYTSKTKFIQAKNQRVEMKITGTIK